jgi:protein gp37
VFVNSTSDLFHEDVPDEWIAAVFGVMAACPQHTFQILTKRAERMRRWFEWAALTAETPEWLAETGAPRGWQMLRLVKNAALATPGVGGVGNFNRWVGLDIRGRWPLPNVWIGVSVEDQRRADERIPHLLRVPAKVRFLSCEPLLRAVGLARWFTRRSDGKPLCRECCWKDGRCDEPRHHFRANCPTCSGTGILSGIDWVIVGGESGHGARPCNLAWVRSLVRQCRHASVPVFVKQLGAHVVGPRHVGTMEGTMGGDRSTHAAGRWTLVSRKGGDISEWPEDLRIRQWPGGAS